MCCEGEVFGFLGPNGAGKSTTIRTLLDEIRPTAGSATILGLDTRADAVEIRRHIGYIPGDLASVSKSDRNGYVAVLRQHARCVDWDWSYVDESRPIGSTLTCRRKVGDLSTGNRQKVGVIQAFMHRPDLANHGRTYLRASIR